MALSRCRKVPFGTAGLGPAGAVSLCLCQRAGVFELGPPLKTRVIPHPFPFFRRLGRTWHSEAQAVGGSLRNSYDTCRSRPCAFIEHRGGPRLSWVLWLSDLQLGCSCCSGLGQTRLFSLQFHWGLRPVLTSPCAGGKEPAFSCLGSQL